MLPVELAGAPSLIKKKRKFSSHIRKFRWTVAKSYMTNGLLMCKEALPLYFVPDLFWISLYMKKFFPSFLLVYQAPVFREKSSLTMGIGPKHPKNASSFKAKTIPQKRYPEFSLSGYVCLSADGRTWRGRDVVWWECNWVWVTVEPIFSLFSIVN